MIIPTHDQPAIKRSRSAFTLVELILVMILMVVVEYLMLFLPLVVVFALIEMVRIFHDLYFL